jgi:hypothetical protein
VRDTTRPPVLPRAIMLSYGSARVYVCAFADCATVLYLFTSPFMSLTSTCVGSLTCKCSHNRSLTCTWSWKRLRAHASSDELMFFCPCALHIKPCPAHHHGGTGLSSSSRRDGGPSCHGDERPEHGVQAGPQGTFHSLPARRAGLRRSSAAVAHTTDCPAPLQQCEAMRDLVDVRLQEGGLSPVQTDHLDKMKRDFGMYAMKVRLACPVHTMRPSPPGGPRSGGC